MSIISKSAHFGLGNFFFVKEDTTDVIYDYVAYVDRKNAILIGRYTKDGTEGLYYLTTGTFATIWAARDTYTYVLPNFVTDPTVNP